MVSFSGGNSVEVYGGDLIWAKWCLLNPVMTITDLILEHNVILNFLAVRSSFYPVN
jgi:hypothetical protein